VSKPTARAAFLLLTLLAVTPRSALAQGWTLPAGENWLRVGLLLQTTDERYFIDGRRIPYFFEGHNETTGFFLDYRRGLTDRLEVDLQVPYFGISFDDLAANRTSGGIGDVRLGLRYNLLSEPFIATLGATVKFPTGEFDNDAEVIPVGEGQWDYEFQLELARSFWPRPGWINGFIGYRFRTENQQTGIDHGNEIFWSAEVGYEVVSRIALKVRGRGLHGGESTSFGFPIPTLKRSAVYVEPGTLIEVSRVGTVEVAVPISLSGRNWPAGPILLIGYFQQF
jgi:hypothetical protein